ncbi:aminotransferase class III-fold pyridoxal phosphate-dependent enzyme, partial [Pyrobaculum sp.]
EVIEEEELLHHAELLGEELKKFFRDELGDRHDVRGLGLMIGVELLDEKKKPAKYLDEVLTKAFKRGVAVIGAGLSTIRVAPPLVIPRDMALRATAIITDILSGYR